MGHLDLVKGFLGETQTEKLQGLIDQGYKTAQEFMAKDGDDAPKIELYRQPVGGGPPSIVGEFEIIMIRFGQRGVTEDDDYGPLRMSSTDGIMRHEAAEFDLKIDDIIIYDDRSCRVSAVYPPEFDVVISEVELMQ